MGLYTGGFPPNLPVSVGGVLTFTSIVAAAMGGGKFILFLSVAQEKCGEVFQFLFGPRIFLDQVMALRHPGNFKQILADCRNPDVRFG